VGDLGGDRMTLAGVRRLRDQSRRDAASGSAPPAATVTLTGHGTEPDAVRLEPVSNLAPLFQGVAALRALTDSALASHDRIRKAAQAGRTPRAAAGSGRMQSALWQRAVREQQRLAGISARAADAIVTSVVNHLGRLLEQAPWLSTDDRLRAAAIDETVRHSMLGARVPSETPQDAWARDGLSADWRQAWAAWAATA
jgi:hypothetical protein